MDATPALPGLHDPMYRRRAGAVGLWALVLLAHGWGLAWGMRQAATSLPVPAAASVAVQARLLAVPTALPLSTEATMPQHAPPKRTRRSEQLDTAASKATPMAKAPAVNAAVMQQQRQSWPTYAATTPPATTRQYLLQRGNHSATAQLVWAAEGTLGSSYQLSFMAEGGELHGLGAASMGSIGLHGLLPQRHVERRRSRDVLATNIDLAEGWVRSSGGGLPYPWVAGGQDRLSWVVQLAAVLQANPQLAQPGEQLQLAVAGARGGVAAWTFEVLGPAEVSLADGSSRSSLALLRAAAHPYDLQAQVWLDPTDHHWPLRLRLSTPPGPWQSVWLFSPPSQVGRSLEQSPPP